MDLELSQVPGCQAHSKLVELLAAIDNRLLRLEVLLLVSLAAAVGSFSKDLVLPLLLKIVGE
jgi:hypothetical protein